MESTSASSNAFCERNRRIKAATRALKQCEAGVRKFDLELKLPAGASATGMLYYMLRLYLLAYAYLITRSVSFASDDSSVLSSPRSKHLQSALEYSRQIPYSRTVFMHEKFIMSHIIVPAALVEERRSTSSSIQSTRNSMILIVFIIELSLCLRKYSGDELPLASGKGRSSGTGLPHLIELYQLLTRHGEDFDFSLSTNNNGTTASIKFIGYVSTIEDTGKSKYLVSDIKLSGILICSYINTLELL